MPVDERPPYPVLSLALPEALWWSLRPAAEEDEAGVGEAKVAEEPGACVADARRDGMTNWHREVEKFVLETPKRHVRA